MIYKIVNTQQTVCCELTMKILIRFLFVEDDHRNVKHLKLIITLDRYIKLKLPVFYVCTWLFSGAQMYVLEFYQPDKF